ncbi:hypothetical protein LJC20_04230 [Eubacteriales bacterium OttesenSCG-928-M02]|nr:hypothetical protein [Eubacteriales bacterium OttesenSCG-928-M02]
MENYREYLPELRTMTVFQGIEDDDLIALLEAMQPKIIKRTKDAPRSVGGSFDTFQLFLRATPANDMVPRRFIYDMPKHGEPGAMMGEIPCLSRMFEVLDRSKPVFPPGVGPGSGPGPQYDSETLEFSPEMLVQYYNQDVQPAQAKMLRNFLGILAQKVMDTRQQLFLARDGIDIFNRE